MEALNTYKTEKTLAEQMNERLAEMKMTKAEAALKMNYSRAALSQYLNGKGGIIMAEQSKDILSEYTKDMTPEQRAELQEKVSNMTEEELKEFRNSLDPDSMGFFGEESV